jgi:stress response protein YsnF
MRSIEMTKYIIGLAMAVSSIAVVTGCHSARSSEASIYSDPGIGATSAASSQSSSSSDSLASRPDSSVTLSQGELSIPLHEEQILVGTRKVESSAVRLRKQVTTETVSQPVQIRRETLVVDREAAGHVSATTNQSGTLSGLLGPFQEGEILIRLYSEEPVVEKRIVPSGRIVAQTLTNTEQMTVQREIRREKIDVEKTGNPQNVTISEKVTRPAQEAVGGTSTGSEQTKGQDKGQDQGSDKDQDQEKNQTPAEKP